MPRYSRTKRILRIRKDIRIFKKLKLCPRTKSLVRSMNILNFWIKKYYCIPNPHYANAGSGSALREQLDPDPPKNNADPHSPGYQLHFTAAETYWDVSVTELILSFDLKNLFFTLSQVSKKFSDNQVKTVFRYIKVDKKGGVTDSALSCMLAAEFHE